MFEGRKKKPVQRITNGNKERHWGSALPSPPWLIFAKSSQLSLRRSHGGAASLLHSPCPSVFIMSQLNDQSHTLFQGLVLHPFQVCSNVTFSIRPTPDHPPPTFITPVPALPFSFSTAIITFYITIQFTSVSSLLPVSSLECEPYKEGIFTRFGHRHPKQCSHRAGRHSVFKYQLNGYWNDLLPELPFLHILPLVIRNSNHIIL